MQNIHDFFRGREVAIQDLSEYLDGLSPSRRRMETESLSAKEQKHLFEATKDRRPVALADIVPEGTPALEQVIHYGKNSLPTFSIFQKRFCRPDEERRNELWGYNHQTLSLFTGPGYFVAKDVGDGEVVIDYRDLPPRKPSTWPRILSNSARLSRFVYFNMQDYLRGVSAHVTIGRAMRDGKSLDNWFVLCREG